MMNKQEPMDEAEKAQLLNALQKLSEQGYNVILHDDGRIVVEYE